MESEITVSAKFRDEAAPQKQQLLDAIDEDSADRLATFLEVLAQDIPDSELKDSSLYRNSIESLVLVREQSDSLELAATCGSEGYDFLLELVAVLGPMCESLYATFMHDEEPDEDEWPMRVEYADGRILINGKDRSASGTVNLEGKYMSLAVLQDEFVVDDFGDELKMYGVHAQTEIDDKTDYVVYFGPEIDEYADKNDEALLEQAAKDGRTLITHVEAQDLLFEYTEAMGL